MKEKKIFFFRLFYLTGILFLSGITFRYFYLQAHFPNPDTVTAIYFSLALFGFFLFYAFILFGKWIRVLFLTVGLTPFFWGVIGLKTEAAGFLFAGALALVVWLIYLEQKEKNIQTSLISQIETAETEGNEMAAEVLTRKQRLNALLKKKDQTTLLREAIRGSSFTQTERALSEMLVQRVLSLVEKGESAALYFLTDDHKHFQKIAESRWNEKPSDRTYENLDVFHQWVNRHRQPLLIEDINKEFRFEIPASALKQNLYPKSLMAVPLVSEDKLLGVLTLSCSLENQFGVDELRLISILTSFFSLTLSNARLYQQTQKLADLDGLTQLFVKRCLSEKLASFFKNKRKGKNTLSLIMLDIDHFKNVNDQFGHLVGDAVLIQVADILRKFSPQGSLICRYGGEEFSILLPDYSKKEAEELAEKLRREVEANILTIRRQQVQITLSAGIASFPDDGLIEENLIKGADQALYRAKKEGRNRVVGV